MARLNKIHNTLLFKRLNTYLDDDIAIVLNTNNYEDINLMFYNPDLDAYSWCLNPDIVGGFKQKHLKIAVFEAHKEYGIPEYLLTYPFLQIINLQLQ